MPQTDYKLVSITEQNDGTTTVVCRVYEGDVTTEREPDPETGEIANVTRYRRTRVLRTLTLRFGPGVDFHAGLRRRLAEDIQRQAITEQSLKVGDILADRGTEL